MTLTDEPEMSSLNSRRRPPNPRRALPILLLALLALLPGCAVFEPSPLAEELGALRRARARWVTAGPSSYRYVYTPVCQCPPTVARATWVVVENGAVTAAEYVDGGTPVTVETRVYATVEQMFAMVQRAYDERAAAVQVTYDPTLGYPTAVRIDWDMRVADEETAFGAAGLVATQ